MVGYENRGYAVNYELLKKVVDFVENLLKILLYFFDSIIEIIGEWLEAPRYWNGYWEDE